MRFHLPDSAARAQRRRDDDRGGLVRDCSLAAASGGVLAATAFARHWALQLPAVVAMAAVFWLPSIFHGGGGVGSVGVVVGVSGAVAGVGAWWFAARGGARWSVSGCPGGQGASSGAGGLVRVRAGLVVLEDTFLGLKVEMEVDMLVLPTAMVPTTTLDPVTGG